MVFCNFINEKNLQKCITSHNPYFNRWFSAIEHKGEKMNEISSHNPYFNRWFSAISEIQFNKLSVDESQSLF